MRSWGHSDNPCSTRPRRAGCLFQQRQKQLGQEEVAEVVDSDLIEKYSFVEFYCARKNQWLSFVNHLHLKAFTCARLRASHHSSIVDQDVNLKKQTKKGKKWFRTIIRFYDDSLIHSWVEILTIKISLQNWQHQIGESESRWILLFISCPGQLNRWPYHSLSKWLIFWF